MRGAGVPSGILCCMSATMVASPPTARGVDAKRALALGRDVLATEAAAIAALSERLGAAFLAAARTLFECRGRVVVTGIGKSGHIARKIAATLASTGTPAFFVHAAEASHGDLGMITADDVVLLLSNSGETDELVSLMPHLKRQGARLIALTGNEQSSLAQAADVHLDASVDAEACPLGLAPTASTTAVIDPDHRIAGIFTDGDLRRCLANVRDFGAERVAGLMTRQPRTIGPER